ncbi:ABC transporter substrate-binding protein [Butyrivibrio sp. JL13D10]|uniref:ABC transporter substrate-binding protein n=1 Tax=Butyrivibrio sp. JL13D10 TaxID=3236815 RepID=UPI0038B45F5E
MKKMILENCRFIKRITAVAVMLFVSVCMLGTGRNIKGVFGMTVNAAENENTIESSEPVIAPTTKSDGSKFRIAYVDYDEYLPASRQFFYILKGLEELGWIKQDSLPLTIEDIDNNNMSTKQIYEKILTADLGDYIEFADDGFYYLGYDDNDMVAQYLKDKAGNGIDMVITFGTTPGLFVKELDLPVPMMDFSATDPVASGIIKSSSGDSGYPNVWAHVEPSPVFRQIKYYHSIQPFKKLGIVIYGDETVSGVPDIEAASESFGYSIVKENIGLQQRGTPEQLEKYYGEVKERIEKVSDSGIDAFYLTVDLINDLSMIEPLIEPLYEKNIPVYMMDDSQAVKNGGLMLIAANDLENVGRFIANAAAQIFNGAEAGKLPCVYSSAPSIYVNFGVAKRINYPLSFEFLAICDDIFM